MTLDSAALIQLGGPYSLFEVKRILKISWSELAWGVREGGFRHHVVDKRYFVELNSILEFENWSRSKRFVKAIREQLEADQFTEEEIRQQLEAFDDPSSYGFISGWQPVEIREYLEFHETINQFTWLLKVRYSPRSELRKRSTRIDSVFGNYLRKNNIQISRLQRLMPAETPDPIRQQRASESLRKVWYNELAYLQPSPSDTMHIDTLGVSRNLERSRERLLFLSWRVTQAYYAVYHAFRGYCDTLSVAFDPKEHHAPMRAFKGSKLSPALDVLLFFPFNLFYTPGCPDQEPIPPKPVKHEHFQYARYPRDRQGSTRLLSRRIWIRFGKSAANWPTARRRNERFMLPDYLYHFRTWANYVNIDNLVDLKGGGFKAYMDLDLMTLIYFYAGFAELLFIARFGETAYVELAQNFHERFVATQPDLNQRTAPWPLAVRLQIYKHLKIIDSQAWEPRRPADPNAVAFCLED